MCTPSEQEALVGLNMVPGLGPARIRELAAHFGSAGAALHATQAELAAVPRMGEALAAAVAAHLRDLPAAVARELECAQQHGVRVVTLADDDYPAVLRERMSDAPPVLYARGEWRNDDARMAVAVVGTRSATPYGLSCARRFAGELAAEGCTIFSGLARGIDTAAHRGALDGGGRTIAVLGGGLAAIFPPENSELAHAIACGNGAVLSEFPMMVRPGRTTFLQRNRIVAAWSKATLVVEAPMRSGALHTAEVAAKHYGGRVYAVPGAVTSERSAGCHALIRNGRAMLCAAPHELLADLRQLCEPKQMSLFPEATPEAAPPAESTPAHPVLAAVAAGHTTTDALSGALGMPVEQLAPQLMLLQMQGRLLAGPGGTYSLAPAR